MGAGLSDRQFYTRVYSRLQKIRRELLKVGIETDFHNTAVIFKETEGSGEGGFNISYRRLNASNGETAGMLRVYISGRGYNEFHEGFDNKGIERVKEIFKSVPTEAHGEARQINWN